MKAMKAEDFTELQFPETLDGAIHFTFTNGVVLWVKDNQLWLTDYITPYDPIQDEGDLITTHTYETPEALAQAFATANGWTILEPH